MGNRYVYEIKRETRGRVAPEGEWFIAQYVPYLGMKNAIMRWGDGGADSSSSPLPFYRFLCFSETL